MKFRKFWCVVLILGLLTGCGSGTEAPPQSPPTSSQTAPQPSSEIIGEQTTPMADVVGDSYKAPPMLGAEFHSTQAVSGVQLDLSALSEGYVAVSAESEMRLKFQVKKDEETYTYDLSSDGTPSIFPLQCGDGTYHFRVMENVVDTKYAELYSETAEVTLQDEFQPYLRPSDYVPFDAGSACVEKARELAAQCDTALDVVSAVYDYICQTVTYDKAKAESVQSGYMPDPDETMASGKGICFDYAALAAAMLRSQGIPTRMIFGYVSPDDLYHAWNMFYIEESGWVTVHYQASGNDWNRLDLTFSANGADGTFIGDGGNYADVYIY